MSYNVLLRALGRDTAGPDPEPWCGEPPLQPMSEPENPCTCKVFDAIGQNPVCEIHGWWKSDPAVLDLADLTRELGSAWDAARATFGGNA